MPSVAKRLAAVAMSWRLVGLSTTRPLAAIIADSLNFCWPSTMTPVSRGRYEGSDCENDAGGAEKIRANESAAIRIAVKRPDMRAFYANCIITGTVKRFARRAPDLLDSDGLG